MKCWCIFWKIEIIFWKNSIITELEYDLYRWFIFAGPNPNCYTFYWSVFVWQFQPIAVTICILLNHLHHRTLQFVWPHYLLLILLRFFCALHQFSFKFLYIHTYQPRFILSALHYGQCILNYLSCGILTQLLTPKIGQFNVRRELIAYETKILLVYRHRKWLFSIVFARILFGLYSCRFNMVSICNAYHFESFCWVLSYHISSNELNGKENGRRMTETVKNMCMCYWALLCGYDFVVVIAWGQLSNGQMKILRNNEALKWMKSKTGRIFFFNSNEFDWLSI